MTTRTYYVYILTNHSHRLYIGMTNDLRRRNSEHKQKAIPGFTKRYNIDILVYYETFSNAPDAIAREKQLKRWRREKKITLIESQNPNWEDLLVD
jgi:putative endonuclease